MKICLCGKKIDKPKGVSHLEWSNRKFCSNTCRLLLYKPSKEAREKMRKSQLNNPHSLEKHPQWKERCIKRSKVIKKLFLRAKRDLTKCENCQIELPLGYNLHFHHKNKDRLNNNLDNILLVCVPCHRRLDGRGFYTDYAKANNISTAGAWAKFNKLKVNKYRRENYQRHKETVKARIKRYYMKHRDKILQRQKEAYRKKRGLV